jgi:hypothetical protein|tara:strand:- start:197 stop:325 length:129 start_codon:yes stop_codon:yes gene_type:complete
MGVLYKKRLVKGSTFVRKLARPGVKEAKPPSLAVGRKIRPFY